MEFIPRPHEIYKHFKGNLYQIVAIAEHTETGETLVIYQALYGDFKTYARPLSMFISPVDREKYPDVKQYFRFELQGDDRERQMRRVGELPEETSGVEPVSAEEPEKVPDLESTNAKKVQNPESTYVKELAEIESSEEELALDPAVLEFLDADSYEQRLNILSGVHHRISDEMITTMAISCDIEVEEGSTEERYESLRNCLLTLERYECNRLR